MEGEVFSLIGPKRFDVPWKEIESQGYIAPAECIEVRVNLSDSERLLYATAEPENIGTAQRLRPRVKLFKSSLPITLKSRFLLSANTSHN